MDMKKRFVRLFSEMTTQEEGSLYDGLTLVNEYDTQVGVLKIYEVPDGERRTEIVGEIFENNPEMFDDEDIRDVEEVAFLRDSLVAVRTRYGWVDGAYFTGDLINLHDAVDLDGTIESLDTTLGGKLSKENVYDKIKDFVLEDPGMYNVLFDPYNETIVFTRDYIYDGISGIDTTLRFVSPRNDDMVVSVFPDAGGYELEYGLDESDFE